MIINKIAFAIKQNNKPLPELNSTGAINFYSLNNSNYSIFFKNLNKSTAYINIFVDEKVITSEPIKLEYKSKINIFKFEDKLDKFFFSVDKDIIGSDLRVEITFDPVDNIEDYIEDFILKIKLVHDMNQFGLNENKKTCPKCKKTFKMKYFYCPYDGVALIK